jgi:hypothetical protein
MADAEASYLAASSVAISCAHDPVGPIKRNASPAIPGSV